MEIEGKIKYCEGEGEGEGVTPEYHYTLDVAADLQYRFDPNPVFISLNETVTINATDKTQTDVPVKVNWPSSEGEPYNLIPNETGTSATFNSNVANTYTIETTAIDTAYHGDSQSITINVVELQIKEGQSAPRVYLGVNDTMQLTAIPNPDISSSYCTFSWTISENANLVEIDDQTQQTITLEAGDNPSLTLNDKVTIEVTFTHSDSGKVYEAYHELYVVRVDLVAIETVADSLLENGLICLNAQDDYKNAKWKAIIKPAGLYGEVTSSAKVSILNIEQEPLVVGDGDPFDIKGNNTGPYELTIKLQKEPSIEGQRESTVFNLILQTTPATYQESTTGQGHVENNTTISFVANSALRHAAHVETRRFSRFITEPVNSYSGYVSARLNAVQLFRSGIRVVNLPHENAVGGVLVFADSLAAEKITIDLSFGIVSVPPISLVNTPQRAFAAWKGELKIQGPNDPEPFTSPTTQTEAKSSNINWLVGGWNWKNINTQSSVGTHINHYEVGNPMSRAVVNTRHSSSGTRTRNSFEAESRAVLPNSDHTPLVTIDLQAGLKLVATETP